MFPSITGDRNLNQEDTDPPVILGHKDTRWLLNLIETSGRGWLLGPALGLEKYYIQKTNWTLKL